MLRSFSCENYKNFQDKVTIDFTNVRDYSFNEICTKNNLINKAIIYGKNASGKTNLGKALMDIRQTILTSGNSDTDIAFIHANSASKEATFEYEFEFHQIIVRYMYKKTAPNAMTYEKLSVNEEDLYSYNYLTQESDFSRLKTTEDFRTLLISNWEEDLAILTYLLNNSKLEQFSVLKELHDFVKGMGMLRPTENKVSFIGPVLFKDGMIANMIKENRVDDFSLFLKRNGIDLPLKVDIKPDGESTLYFNYKRPIEFVSNASSGVKTLTGIFSILTYIDKLSFLFIDEFDANFHFEMATSMLEEFKTLSAAQILITTHNTDLMSNKYMRPDCYLILDNNEIRPLADLTQRELRLGHNLEKLYQSGEFV